MPSSKRQDPTKETAQPWVFEVKCDDCTTKGFSCPCVGGGGGGYFCLRSQWWHKKGTGGWACPECRHDYVVGEPDWIKIQNHMDTMCRTSSRHKPWECACETANRAWRHHCRKCGEAKPGAAAAAEGAEATAAGAAAAVWRTGAGAWYSRATRT